MLYSYAVRKSTYLYVHNCVRWFHFFVFGVCDVLLLVVVMCTLSGFFATAVHTVPWSHGHTAFRLHHPASRWSQVWYDKIISCRAGGSSRTV